MRYEPTLWQEEIDLMPYLIYDGESKRMFKLDGIAEILNENDETIKELKESKENFETALMKSLNKIDEYEEENSRWVQVLKEISDDKNKQIERLKKEISQLTFEKHCLEKWYLKKGSFISKEYEYLQKLLNNGDD